MVNSANTTSVDVPGSIVGIYGGLIDANDQQRRVLSVGKHIHVDTSQRGKKLLNPPRNNVCLVPYLAGGTCYVTQDLIYDCRGSRTKKGENMKWEDKTTKNNICQV